MNCLDCQIKLQHFTSHKWNINQRIQTFPFMEVSVIWVSSKMVCSDFLRSSVFFFYLHPFFLSTHITYDLPFSSSLSTYSILPVLLHHNHPTFTFKPPSLPLSSKVPPLPYLIPPPPPSQNHRPKFFLYICILCFLHHN